MVPNKDSKIQVPYLVPLRSQKAILVLKLYGMHRIRGSHAYGGLVNLIRPAPVEGNQSPASA